MNEKSHDVPKILVCEDDAIIQDIITTYIEEAGLDVIGPFSDVATAMKAVETEHADVAVLDVHLTAKEKSYPVARQMISDGTPVVFCTGANDSLPEEFASTSVLAKPFSGTMLVDAIKAQLDPT